VFATKSQRYSTTFTRLRQSRITYRRAQRYPDGEKDPWGREIREQTVLMISAWQRGTIRPWSADEAKQFLGAARPDPLCAAFVLLILYGLRRGEALGLRWTDIDSDAGTVQVRQQLQRIQGQLILGPVKTRAGQRDMPLLDLAREALEGRVAQQAAHRADMGSA